MTLERKELAKRFQWLSLHNFYHARLRYDAADMVRHRRTSGTQNVSQDNNEAKTVVYIDFARAFDTVSRPKLLTKLQAYGISGNLLRFIASFLTERTQKTRVGQSLSTAASLISGIVQGSCLGPLLFLIYINDITAIFDKRVKPKLFADDLKLYTTVKNDGYRSVLQANLDKLDQWAND